MDMRLQDNVCKCLLSYDSGGLSFLYFCNPFFRVLDNGYTQKIHGTKSLLKNQQKEKNDYMEENNP